MMSNKVNSTQAEAITMVCAQVIGNDVSINIRGMKEYIQLNTNMPMINR